MATKPNSFKRNCLALGIASAISIALPSATIAAEANSFEINISKSPAAVALLELAEQSGAQIIFSRDIGRDFTLSELKGEHTLNSALDEILAGSGLEYELLSDDSVVIKVKEGDQGEGASDDPDEEVDEEVVVTGTRLKLNSSELSGNRVTLDREYIERSGEVTLPDLLRKLPQSTNNTVNVFGSDLNGAHNLSGATAINLRGVGTNNTLVLVDGRRIGSHGLASGVSDISSIPLASVERIEVLLEGASAIYGSDAVGGVINIITRRDYESIDVSLDYSQPTAGSTNQMILSATGGFSWESGRARVGLEYQKTEPLDAMDVDLITDHSLDRNRFDVGAAMNVTSQSDPATPIFYRGPDNITIAEFTALTLAERDTYSPVTAFTAPTDWDGSDLNAITVFNVTPRTQEDLGRNRTLIPESERRSINVGVEQDLSDNITLDVDIRYAEREVFTETGNSGFVTSEFNGLNRFNPFGVGVNLNGWLPGIPELPQTSSNDGTDLNVNLSLDGEFGDSSWSWGVTGGYTRNKSENTQKDFLDARPVFNGVNADGIPVTVGIAPPSDQNRTVCENTLDRRWIVVLGHPNGNDGACVITETTPAFQPFGGDYASFIIPNKLAVTDNTSKRFEVITNGTLMELPGGGVQLSAGGSWRESATSSFTPFNQSGGPATLEGILDLEVSRPQKAVFVESFVPLVSEANSLPGINSLSMNLSARYDSYDDTEVVRNSLPTDPCLDDDDELIAGCDTSASDTSYSLGFVYTPVDDSLRFRANWSTSFVAPQVNQLFKGENPTLRAEGFQLESINDDCPENFSATRRPLLCLARSLWINGGNPTLTAEMSDTWSVGADLEPEWLPGLTARVTWSRLKTVDRITDLTIPDITDVDNLPAGITFHPEDPVAKYRRELRPFNVALLNREGLDYQLQYSLDTSAGTFDFQTNYSRVLKFEVTESLGDEPIDGVGGKEGRRGLGAVPKYSASAQLGWALGGMKASIDYNKSGSITNLPTPNSISIVQSPTLYNLTLSYDMASETLFDAPDWLDGAKVAFRVNNLTNDFTHSEQILAEGTFQGRIDPSRSYLKGRSFGLNLSKTFD